MQNQILFYLWWQWWGWCAPNNDVLQDYRTSCLNTFGCNVINVPSSSKNSESIGKWCLLNMSILQNACLSDWTCLSYKMHVSNFLLEYFDYCSNMAHGLIAGPWGEAYGKWSYEKWKVYSWTSFIWVDTYCKYQRYHWHLIS